MSNLDKWTEITRGLYRYVIACMVCYEIHILEWYTATDIMDAKASAYVAGLWNVENGPLFERECIANNKSVLECIEACKKDYDENVT